MGWSDTAYSDETIQQIRLTLKVLNQWTIKKDFNRNVVNPHRCEVIKCLALLIDENESPSDLAAHMN